MYSLLPLLLAILLEAGVGAQKIHQWPATKLQVAGSQLFLECFTEGTSSPNLYWYHQPPGGVLQLLSYSMSQNHVENEMPQRFLGSRPQDGHFQLSSPKLLVTDSGFYFCAWSSGTSSNAAQTFGSGSRLVILDDLERVTPPKVTVFQPSEEEIGEKGKATLVCLATGFYPDLVELSWWVNGQETKIGVSTDPEPSKEHPKEEHSSYSLSSRLRISAPFWRNPKNNFRCQVQFYGIAENETWSSNRSKPVTQNVSDQIWGKADCGITSVMATWDKERPELCLYNHVVSILTESYQHSIQSATFLYEILLGKAVLYGLLVSALVWITMAKKKNS